MVLGAVTEKNGLKEARAAARDAHALIAKGSDPIEERRRPAGVPSFADASRSLIETLAPSWRGRDTRARWERCLLRYAKALARRPVDEITAADVLAVLRPMWATKPESAKKTRECIERVLDAQRAAGSIRGAWENPARWRGHLALALPKPKRGDNRPAMPFAEAPAFVQAIRNQDGMGARALEFAILTATREGVVIAAEWKEIDGDLWVIPKEKMKGDKELRVPLTPAAIAVLDRVAGVGREGWVFPGQRQRRHRGAGAPHISDATMDSVLKRMRLPYVPHGFRSTFKDWSGECTEHADEVSEEALAHVVGDETRRAYRRGDALDRRRALMSDWAAFLG
jgi:integrase